MRINQVIKNLVFSDLVLNSALGMAAPIFAIFITEQIRGGDVRVAGYAVGVYWILKSLLQMPLAHWLDKNHGEVDDFWFMEIGLIITSLASLFFAFAKVPWHLYGLQAIKAVAMAMALPAWNGIFTRHIDKGKEAFDWGFDSTAIGLGAGITGALGGLYVMHFSYQSLFILTGVVALVGALVPLLIKNKMIPSQKDSLAPTVIRRIG